jgi:DNA modification methylase
MRIKPPSGDLSNIQAPPRNWKSLQIIELPIATLHSTKGNPNRHDRRQIQALTRSLKAFGFNVPILIDSGRNVLAGDARLLAAKELGLDLVPTIELSHLDEARAKAFMIADNRLAQMARWDEKVLAIWFKELSDIVLDFSLEDTGFTMGEIDILIEGLSGPGTITQDAGDIIPALGPAVTTVGSTWLLGRHRVSCANALDDSSFPELMAGQKARLVFTDPPYNVRIPGHASGNGRVRHRNFITASGEMTPEEYTAFLRSVIVLLVLYSIDGSLHYLFIDWRHIEELQRACRGAYSELKNVCVWVKTNAGLGSFYRSQHELVFIYKQGKKPHRNNVQLGRFGRDRTNVWTFAGANSFGRAGEEGNLLAMHPTVKPVALVANAILDASERGDIVLDPFLGSGTTIIAAERTGRTAYGLELDPAYVDVIVRRWQLYTGEQARNAHTGKTFDETAAEMEESSGAA